jgi:hypothetical protein
MTTYRRLHKPALLLLAGAASFVLTMSAQREQQGHNDCEEQVGLLGFFSKAEATNAKKVSISIAGYGVVAKPRLPVKAGHLENGTVILGWTNKNGDVKNVVLAPGKSPTGTMHLAAVPTTTLKAYTTGQEGATRLVLGEGMESYDSVLESFGIADSPAKWRISTDDYQIQWPARLTLRATGDLAPGSRAAFDLGFDGSSENFLYIQGPFTGPTQIPAPDQLVVPGMEKVGDGHLAGNVNTVIWFELGYEQGGSKWRQRWYYLPSSSESVYLLRAQAKSDISGKMFEAADIVAASFQPRH